MKTYSKTSLTIPAAPAMLNIGMNIHLNKRTLSPVPSRSFVMLSAALIISHTNIVIVYPFIPITGIRIHTKSTDSAESNMFTFMEYT